MTDKIIKNTVAQFAPYGHSGAGRNSPTTGIAGSLNQAPQWGAIKPVFFPQPILKPSKSFLPSEPAPRSVLGIPADAGIQAARILELHANHFLDPGLRRDDGILYLGSYKKSRLQTISHRTLLHYNAYSAMPLLFTPAEPVVSVIK